MSTAKVVTILHPSSAVNNIVNDASGNVAVGNTLAMGSSFKRNRIINGNMLIDQRNAGASVSTTAVTTTFFVDRWFANPTQTGKFTVQQNAGSVTPPTGFSYYLGAVSTSAYAVTAADYFYVSQSIEGYNFSDLGFGTASAKTITVSFVVYSSLTGTFAGSLRNYAGTRSYPFSYSIPVANTWTTISVTIPGDTSGTWVGSTNAGSAILFFSLGTGSTFSGTSGAWAAANYVSATGAVSVVGTSGATFYITGVQLEVGTKATPYEMQIYSDQLAQCQRYFAMTFSQGTAPANNTATTGALRGTARVINATSQIEPAANWRFPVTMRSSPTITLYSSGSGSTTAQWNNDGSTSYSANARSQFVSDSNADINNAGVVLTASVPWQIQATASAEL